MGTTEWFELARAPAPGTALCPAESVADGQAKLVWLLDGKVLSGFVPEAFGLILLKSAGTLSAYANRCAHFGVPLANREEHFRFVPHESISCNIHYAKYDWQDGRCVSGECNGEALVPIPVYIDDSGCIRVGPG